MHGSKSSTYYLPLLSQCTFVGTSYIWEKKWRNSVDPLFLILFYARSNVFFGQNFVSSCLPSGKKIGKCLTASLYHPAWFDGKMWRFTHAQVHVQCSAISLSGLVEGNVRKWGSVLKLLSEPFFYQSDHFSMWNIDSFKASTRLTSSHLKSRLKPATDCINLGVDKYQAGRIDLNIFLVFLTKIFGGSFVFDRPYIKGWFSLRATTKRWIMGQNRSSPPFWVAAIKAGNSTAALLLPKH